MALAFCAESLSDDRLYWKLGAAVILRVSVFFTRGCAAAGQAQSEKRAAEKRERRRFGDGENRERRRFGDGGGGGG